MKSTNLLKFIQLQLASSGATCSEQLAHEHCIIDDNVARDAGTRKGPGRAEFVEGHRQNFNYVKIHILEFGGSVAFLLRQILTNHILSIASAMTLNINTSQISSIDRVTAGFIITN